MRHTSVAKEGKKGFVESNERLEYLGDAVLGTIVAEYLFNKYPFKDEGFLTEVRSRIVNRENLNQLSKKIGLAEIVTFSGNNRQSFKSIYGDALEALVGAVYVDRGFKKCQKFVIKKLLLPHLDIDSVAINNTNFKSKIIEWSQKENRKLSFEVKQVEKKGRLKNFEANIVIDGKVTSTAHGLNKKKAEQNAAEKSCQLLNIE